MSFLFVLINIAFVIKRHRLHIYNQQLQHATAVIKIYRDKYVPLTDYLF